MDYKQLLAKDTSAVKVIADTVAVTSGARITTLELFYPRFILAEVNTHGLLAKSTQSSRAVPTLTRVKELREVGAYFPDFYSAEIVNQPGMVAAEDQMLPDPARAVADWNEALHAAVNAAESMAKGHTHKQFASRVLEPYLYTKTVITATEWDNFFHLRLSTDAQPEFRDLARKIKTVRDASTPVTSFFHTPYADCGEIGTFKTVDELDAATEEQSRRAVEATLVSSARCARVSYFSFSSGKISSVEEDMKMAKDLWKNGHHSPFDHAACADGRNATTRFKGWTAIRNTTMMENN